MADLGEKDYADVIEMAVTKLQGGLHLDLFPARKRFVTVVFSEKVVPVLTQCIMEGISPSLSSRSSKLL